MRSYFEIICLPFFCSSATIAYAPGPGVGKISNTKKIRFLLLTVFVPLASHRVSVFLLGRCCLVVAGAWQQSVMRLIIPSDGTCYFIICGTRRAKSVVLVITWPFTWATGLFCCPVERVISRCECRFDLVLKGRRSRFYLISHKDLSSRSHTKCCLVRIFYFIGLE